MAELAEPVVLQVNYLNKGGCRVIMRAEDLTNCSVEQAIKYAIGEKVDLGKGKELERNVGGSEAAVDELARVFADPDCELARVKKYVKRQGRAVEVPEVTCDKRVFWHFLHGDGHYVPEFERVGLDDSLESTFQTKYFTKAGGSSRALHPRELEHRTEEELRSLDTFKVAELTLALPVNG